MFNPTEYKVNEVVTISLERYRHMMDELVALENAYNEVYEDNRRMGVEMQNMILKLQKYELEYVRRLAVEEDEGVWKFWSWDIADLEKNGFDKYKREHYLGLLAKESLEKKEKREAEEKADAEELSEIKETEVN